MQKNVTFKYLYPIFGNLGVMHDFGWWLAGKPMVDFLFVNWTFSRYLLQFRSYDAKCVQLGCFRRGSTSLHSNFTWTGSSPSNRSWRQKTRYTWLPDGEDRIPLRFLVLTQYRSVTDGHTDRRTDGQTGGFAVAYIALRRAVVKSSNKSAAYQLISVVVELRGESRYRVSH